MANLVIFHSALGLRPALLRWADRLRDRGHQVHTPDLFDGEVFDELEQGVAKRDAIGIPELIYRAHAAVAELPEDLFYAGFSMGAASAQMLAGSRPGARGAILMHAALPLPALQIASWPAAVPVQLHYAEEDPWVDEATVEALQAALVDQLEIHRYPGANHLFADDDSPDFAAESASAMLERAEQFIGSAGSTAK